MLNTPYSKQILRRTGAGIALLLLLASCGGAAPAPTAAPAPPTAAAVVPTAPPVVPTEASIGATGGDTALITQGRALFETGKGCAGCHGVNATGNATIGAPNIQGKNATQIRTALDGVQMMSEIKLTSDELKAIVAHLSELSKQTR